MEDLFVYTADELPATEAHTEVSEEELYPDFAAEKWDHEATPEKQLISDSYRPDFDDTLESILSRQVSGQTHYSETDKPQPIPTKSKVEVLPRKRLRKPPQRYSPPINTEPVPGLSRLPTGTDRTIRRGRPQKDPHQRDEPVRRGRLKMDSPLQKEKRQKRERRSKSTQTDSDPPQTPTVADQETKKTP